MCTFQLLNILVQQLEFSSTTQTPTAANLNILDVDIAVVAVYFFVCDPEMAIYKSDKF